jgi:hypothetical protein
MLKIISTGMILLALLLSTGCDQIANIGGGGTTSTEGPDIVRQEDLGDDWQMAQMRVSVPAGEDNSVLLRVKQGDEVDGYYFLEKGEDIRFELIGDAVIYQSPGISDRFTFIVPETVVTTYTLTFSNPTEREEIVFLEVIFPIEADLFFPISANK